MWILKFILLFSTFSQLFSCSAPEPEKPQPVQNDKPARTVKKGYLKDNISQAVLNNRAYYKRYNYRCQNMENGAAERLVTYFPLSLESRRKESLGFYFQLNGGKPEPFDHVENKKLNAKATRFEVIYFSYKPIQGTFVDLIARSGASIYYKNRGGIRTPWLKCTEN